MASLMPKAWQRTPLGSAWIRRKLGLGTPDL
jgi:hypothetical protein